MTEKGLAAQQTSLMAPKSSAEAGEFYDPYEDEQKEWAQKTGARFYFRDANATPRRNISETSTEEFRPPVREVMPDSRRERSPVKAKLSNEFIAKRRKQYITDIIITLTRLIEYHGETSSFVYWSELKDTIHEIFSYFSEIREEEVFVQCIAALELSTIAKGWEQYSPEKLVGVRDLLSDMHRKDGLAMEDYRKYIVSMNRKGISTFPTSHEEI